MTKTKNQTHDQPFDTCARGTTLPIDTIDEPGAYICNWSGHLLRVREDDVAPGYSPLASVVGQGPLFVTKISDNPYIPVTNAKFLAANFDVAVNF